MQLTVDHFECVEQFEAFKELTKIIPQKKVPLMPIKKMGEYLGEYNKIMEGVSELSAAQRIHVKNVINHEARQGTVKLEFKYEKR